ncbi:arsenate reductase/protein-tyrosine-phosphatase family protein [Rhodococcus chondri]|uniref:Low molecular weight phosphatase family protein n=1 Tax=Rhodococcus chondri TaxID=3065941 RepID=A0ABU7JUS5_9NOCA|nr:low molecular weight phosphatase family protein [Rhodococcus sp. CC-R104]MEE2033771.1 low molecular weight phosphatase family protein [Rhodococcus sp. CC-R104]
MHILFVCSGNVCRSVIAERLTRAYAVDRRTAELTAESAGTHALVGYPIEPRAAAVIEGLGGETGRFRARRVSAEMMRRADLVLAMTEAQRDRVSALAAGSSVKSFTLTEASRIATVTGADTVARLDAYREPDGTAGTPGIPDPVGLSEAAFVGAGDRIAEALFPLLTILTARRAGDLTGTYQRYT